MIPGTGHHQASNPTRLDLFQSSIRHRVSQDGHHLSQVTDQGLRSTAIHPGQILSQGHVRIGLVRFMFDRRRFGREPLRRVDEGKGLGELVGRIPGKDQSRKGRDGLDLTPKKKKNECERCLNPKSPTDRWYLTSRRGARQHDRRKPFGPSRDQFECDHASHGDTVEVNMFLPSKMVQEVNHVMSHL